MGVPADVEARLRAVEGISAENRWRLGSVERNMERTAEILRQVEERVEHLGWLQEQSAASVSKRQALWAAVAVAVASPVIASVITYLLVGVRHG